MARRRTACAPASLDAQSELILGPGQRGRGASTERRPPTAPLRRPARGRRPDRARSRAARAGRRRGARRRRGDQARLAAARGAARAALFRGSYAVALGRRRARRRGRPRALAARARVPDRDALHAPGRRRHARRLAVSQRAGSPGPARQAVAKDLLDAYQARLRELLDDAARGAERGLPSRRAEAAAQAAGYFAILAARYAQDRGARAARRATAAFAALRADAGDGDRASRSALRAPGRALEGFTAAPLTREEAARRAQQLLQFLALVPVEYGRGVSGTQVTKDFEIQEAVAFHGGAAAALADLADQLAKRDGRAPPPARRARRLGALLDTATKRPDRVAPVQDVEQLAERTEDALRRRCPTSGRRRPTSPTTT